MGYCAYTDVQNLIGTDLTSTILSALIDDADREIDAYLAPFNMSGSGSGAVKTASIKLTVARVLAYGGAYTSSDTVLTAINELRKEAFEILRWYISDNVRLTSNYLVVRA